MSFRLHLRMFVLPQVALALAALLATVVPQDRAHSQEPIDDSDAGGLVEVLVEAQADGVEVSSAIIRARGVDPARPWLTVLRSVDENQRPDLHAIYGTARFLVPSGARIGIAVFDKEHGCKEIEVHARADSNRAAAPSADPPRMTVEVELPPRARDANLEFTVNAQESRRGSERRVALTSPRFGLGIGLSAEIDTATGEAHLELPASDYRIVYEEPWSPPCGEFPPMAQERTHVDEIVHFEPGETKAIARQISGGSPIALMLEVEGHTQAIERDRTEIIDASKFQFGFDDPPPTTPWIASITVRRQGSDEDCAVRESWARFHQSYPAFLEVVPIGESCFSSRAYPAGNYVVTVRGPGIETSSTVVAVPDAVGFQATYRPVGAVIRLEARASIGSEGD